MQLSDHFDSTEFRCNCGKEAKISELLITRLEALFDLMNAKAITINSGYRCPQCSVLVGGTSTDAHTKGLAADISVVKQDGGYYTGYDIAEAAERIGFGGIGVMTNACHVDTRDKEKYSNIHWYGDEITGNDWIKTFQRGTVFPEKEKEKKEEHSLVITIDGKTVFKGQVEI